VGDLPFAHAICGLPYNLIHNNLLNGSFNPFLAASTFALLNTVSENYARELRETDDDVMTGWLGHRLMARGIRLEGITNGFNSAGFEKNKPKKTEPPGTLKRGYERAGREKSLQAEINSNACKAENEKHKTLRKP